MFMIMVTNLSDNGSYLLEANKTAILKSLYPKFDNDNFVKGLLSRKKQLIPKIIKILGEK